MELNIPDTVDHIFRDFKARREALIDALTTGNFEEVELLCHRGFPDEMWNIDLPRAIGPPHFPKPPECINIARDSMQDKDWLALVAAYCDAWLLSISFFFAAKAGFDKAERDRLFYMINDLPSISEVVTTAAAKNESSDTSKSLPKSILDEIEDGKYDADAEDGDEKKDEEDDEDENENGGHLCGSL